MFKFNYIVIERPTPVATIRETLPTVYWDSDGNIVDTRRQTNIELYEADVDSAWIYELGIPVVEHDGRFHINVGQKVPLNSARDQHHPLLPPQAAGDRAQRDARPPRCRRHEVSLGDRGGASQAQPA